MLSMADFIQSPIAVLEIDKRLYQDIIIFHWIKAVRRYKYSMYY